LPPRVCSGVGIPRGLPVHLIVANAPRARLSTLAADDYAWLAQAGMFLLLFLLVTP
jgi:NhaP-type Na+/H+ and K+/H+ antiporter